MKVGFVQFNPVFGDVETNLATIERLISSTEADLLVLPELATTGYTFTTKKELESIAEPFATSESLRRLQALASQNTCAIVVGFAEQADEGLFNSAALLRPDGTRERYRKIHLFGAEKLFFEPGNLPFTVHECQGVRLGMIVCFDWYFPESIRTLALRGVQIVCQPANLVLQWCQRAMIIRSVENRIFTITANRYGTESRGKYSFAFTGKSQVTAPAGDVVIQAPGEGDFVSVAEIDPAEALNKQVTRYNNIPSDRRPEYYTIITQPGT